MKQLFSFILVALQKILILCVRFYQIFISALLPNYCRFRPTCSEYMIEAINTRGFYGFILGLKRILTCHPFGGEGYDPVPKKKSSLTLKE